MKLLAAVVGLAVVLVVSGAPAANQDAAAAFSWCVPEELRSNCSRLVNAAGVPIACVGGVDRTDCLRKVRNRQADYVMADPEDLYVAMHLENQDFVVFEEQRSLEEPRSPFRYEGIMLVRASDHFHSLADLRGKKSCHTGFGRNVGYKIPVARLQRAGVLKLRIEDDSMSTVERELSALSELFSASCLPGSYSPNADIDQLLKQRYANLCQRCDAPAQCSKADKYSGYDGAIRCLVENGGDVAFTKTIFVRKYFGLPVTPGGTAKPALNPHAQAKDYVYLCEDGTTRPIAEGTAPCSWAQRPWPVLLGNGDISGARVQQLQALTQQLDRYYTADNSEASEADRTDGVKLRISKATPLASRDPVSPRSYLEKANYVEVIEREGPYGSAIRLCVTSEAERQKCELMGRVAYARAIRPLFQCVLKTEESCIAAVRSGKEVDAVVLKQHTGDLKAIVSEVSSDRAGDSNERSKGSDVSSTGAAVYVSQQLNEATQDSIVHGFIELSEAFAPGKPSAQVFRLFGPFAVQNQPATVSNLIFNDKATGLVALSKNSLSGN